MENKCTCGHSFSKHFVGEEEHCKESRCKCESLLYQQGVMAVIEEIEKIDKVKGVDIGKMVIYLKSKFVRGI